MFLRNHHLHKARRMLLDEASSVKEAAYSCGFTEMGRFSEYYKKLFGENPSETLARRIDGRCSDTVGSHLEQQTLP